MKTKLLLEELYRTDSRKVLATLIRLLGDFDLAEEAMHEAFAVALERWPETGLPANPTSWLISTGRFKAIDRLRRQKRFQELEPELNRRWEEIEERNSALAGHQLQDDRLRLIFTCCHPALGLKAQIPLTLREVCGLTTGEIAKAYLISQEAMAQRLVRAKAKIRQAGIPFLVPEAQHLPDRLEAVLKVIYLVYNEGYAASEGPDLVRVSLSQEAIRLGRLLLELLPEPEVKGLLALMLLHESRRKARTDRDGEIVLLKDQDRSVWDRNLISEGDRLLTEALNSGRAGTYTLQASISAVHAQAARPEDTDWRQILALYDLLVQLEPGPVIALNRAVAVAQIEGPQAGLDLVDDIANSGQLLEYPLFHSARGEWLLQLHRNREAAQALELALSLTQSESEKRFLTRKLQACRSEASLIDK